MTFRVGKNSGGGGRLGTAQQAAPAHPCYTVGAVGFGPSLDDDEDGWVRLTDKGWKSITDSMAASIVRLECEADELRAEVALLREQARIITAERDEARKLAESAMFEADRLRGRLARLERERDEAREALREIHELLQRDAAWDTPNNVSGSLVMIEHICDWALQKEAAK